MGIVRNTATFVKMWQSYPYPPTTKRSKDGYENECAIRMSIALIGAGISFGDYTEPKSSEGWARGAESLATWLWRRRLGRPKIYNSTPSFKEKAANLDGIVFFKDCFIRSGQSKKLGDHIDLWNRGTTLSWNDPNNKAEQVWFWTFG